MAYSYYRTVTVDFTKVAATQSNFAVAVVGTIPDLALVANGGYVQNSSGYDIGFFADSGLTTKLDWETVYWDGTTGTVEYHVSIPTLSSTANTVFYLAYDDSTITTDQSNKTATWDVNFYSVYHFGNGATLSAADSTTNAVNGTITAATATTGAFGAGSAAFNGTSAHIDATYGASFTAPYSVSMWVKATTTGQTNFAGVYDSNTASGTSTFQISPNGSSPGSYEWAYATGSLVVIGAESTSWVHLAVTRDASNHVTTYYNGALANTGTFTTGAGDTLFANRFGVNRGGTIFFAGAIDEARISNAVRSSTWIATEYANQSSPTTFYTLGARTSTSGGTTVILGQSLWSWGVQAIGVDAQTSVAFSPVTWGWGTQGTVIVTNTTVRLATAVWNWGTKGILIGGQLGARLMMLLGIGQ